MNVRKPQTFTCITSVSVFDRLQEPTHPKLYYQTETAGETENKCQMKVYVRLLQREEEEEEVTWPHTPPAGQILTNNYYVLHLKVLREII